MENKESPYYNGNCDFPPIIFEFECGGSKITNELHWDASSDDLCEAFYRSCSQFIDPKLLLNEMKCCKSGDKDAGLPPRMLSFIMRVKSEQCVMSVEYTRPILSDLCLAFHTLCVGLTYDYDTAYNMMREWAMDFLGEEPEDEETEIDTGD